MTTEEERLRRHVRALATVNHQLHAQVAERGAHRRAALSKEWLERIRSTPVDDEPVLARLGRLGVWVIEGGVRRAVRSGLIGAALEAVLPSSGDLTADELEALPEGAPVEVYEAPTGPPFVIVGRRRLVVRGLPLPSPISAEEALALPEGPELRLRTGPGPDAAASSKVRELPLPTFLIIGAQKSATRWLRSNLGRHPDIFTPPHEPSFFNHEEVFHERGLAWYRSQFEGWAGEPVVGESTPGYMMWRHGPERVARRIDRTLPDVRLIAILRNPMDRAQSAMVHHMKRGRLPADARLADLVRAVPPTDDQLGLVAGGWYAASLGPFMERFGDRLLVLLHDDLADDARGIYRRALEHVGADPDFVPVELEQVRFSNRKGPTRPQDPTFEEAQELWEHFRDDVVQLEQLLGRDLSMWAPSEAPPPEPDDAPPGESDGDPVESDGDAEPDDHDAVRDDDDDEEQES